MIKSLLLLGSILLFSASCSRQIQPSVIGHWQGQDSSGNTIAIAFTPSGEYHLSVNANPLIGTQENQPLRYQVVSSSRKRAEVMVFETQEDLVRGYQSILHADFKSQNKMALSPEVRNASAEQAIYLTRE